MSGKHRMIIAGTITGRLTPGANPNRLPRVGDHVRVTGTWSGKRLDITGVVLASPRNPNQPQYQTDAGHWRARIHTESGVDFEIPWSTKIMRFEVPA